MMVLNKTVLLRLLVLVFSIALTKAQECTRTHDGAELLCDEHERCPIWEEEGECIRASKYMQKHCAASCSGALDGYSRKECKDMHEHCSIWADPSVGECTSNAINMKKYCPRACGFCGRSKQDKKNEKQCEDLHENCSYWAEIGECENNPKYMKNKCAKSCDVCPEEATDEEQEEIDALLKATTEFGIKQEATGSEKYKTLKVIRESIEYMQSDEIEDLPEKVAENCLNRKELCAFWAVVGECEKNEAYMLVNCAPSCKSCQLIDMEARCPHLEDAVPALRPGDLNKMFQRIVDTAPGNRTLSDEERRELQEEGTPEYWVNVHSRPEATSWDAISKKIDTANPPWYVVDCYMHLWLR